MAGMETCWSTVAILTCNSPRVLYFLDKPRFENFYLVKIKSKIYKQLKDGEFNCRLALLNDNAAYMLPIGFSVKDVFKYPIHIKDYDEFSSLEEICFAFFGGIASPNKQ